MKTVSIRTLLCAILVGTFFSGCQESSVNPIEIVPTGFFLAKVVTDVADDDVVLPNYTIQILDGRTDDEGNAILKLSTTFVADTSSTIPRTENNLLLVSKGTYSTDNPRFAGITPLGEYDVFLHVPDSTGGENSVPVNCAVDGTNPRKIVIEESKTTIVDFLVHCADPLPKAKN